MGLLNQSIVKSNETPKFSLAGLSKSKTNNQSLMDFNALETVDEDREFLELTDLIDMDRTYLDSAIEKFEETNFDAFTFS